MDSMQCWFNLPSGETAKELDVTVPVKGRIKLHANIAAEFDEWRDLLLESMQKTGYSYHGTLKEMLKSCIASYERVASEALEGASSVRDDMIIMLRSVMFVLETVVVDHLNHGQKNERIRGCMSVLERHISSLRDERFTFRDSLWRRHPDLFRWDQTEKHLRDKIHDLENRIKELCSQQEERRCEKPNAGDPAPAPS